MFNLKNTSLETAANTICRLVNSPEFQRTDERVQDLTNKALAARVQAAVEANPKTREADVNIHADGPVIILSGQIAHENLRSELNEVASKVRGVSGVNDHLTIL